MQISKIGSQMTMANSRQRTQNHQVAQNQKSDVSFGSIGPNLGKILLSESAVELANKSGSKFSEFVNLLNKTGWNAERRVIVIGGPGETYHLLKIDLNKGSYSRTLNLSGVAEHSDKAYVKIINKLLVEDLNLNGALKKVCDLESKSAEFKTKMVPKLQEKLEKKVIPAIDELKNRQSETAKELGKMKEEILKPESKISDSDIISKDNELNVIGSRLLSVEKRKTNLEKHIVAPNCYDESQKDVIKAADSELVKIRNRGHLDMSSFSRNMGPDTEFACGSRRSTSFPYRVY